MSEVVGNIVVDVMNSVLVDVNAQMVTKLLYMEFIFSALLLKHISIAGHANQYPKINMTLHREKSEF